MSSVHQMKLVWLKNINTYPEIWSGCHDWYTDGRKRKIKVCLHKILLHRNHIECIHESKPKMCDEVDWSP